MRDIEKILFPKKINKKLDEKSLNLDYLFNTEADCDVTDVTVSYFLLKKDIELDEENIIYRDTKVMGVGFCEKTNMINVCFNETKSKKYFWVNSDDVSDPIVIQEKWKLKDVKLHNKAIKEKWVIEKNTEVTEKNIKKD